MILDVNFTPPRGGRLADVRLERAAKVRRARETAFFCNQRELRIRLCHLMHCLVEPDTIHDMLGTLLFDLTKYPSQLARRKPHDAGRVRDRG